jgi:hypothetical protein
VQLGLQDKAIMVVQRTQLVMDLVEVAVLAD